MESFSSARVFFLHAIRGRSAALITRAISIAIMLAVPVCHAQYRVLFIGNSFTFGDRVDGNPNDDASVPEIFHALAVAGGHPQPLVSMSAVAGRDFQYHAGMSSHNFQGTLNALSSQNPPWTHVVLQNYSTEPTHATGLQGSVTDHLVYGGALYLVAMDLEPRPIVLFYETWARAAVNAIYTGTSTTNTFVDPEEFQNEIAFNYQRLSDLVNFEGQLYPRSEISPVGDAWESAGGMLSSNNPNFTNLFTNDNYHGNDSGYYLSAAVFYSKIYGVSPAGLHELVAPALGLNLTNPQFLEEVAWAVVTGQTEPISSYLIDFGGTSITTHASTAGNDEIYHWNNVSQSTVNIPNLIQASNGNAGSVGLQVLNPFSGLDTSGTTTSTLFPSNATRDSLTANNGAPQPSFKLTGLNTGSRYSFTFYASRTSGTDNRETRFNVWGGTSGFANLNPVRNANKSATVFGIAPTGSGEITISLSPAANNNNSTATVHVGAVRVEESVSNPQPVVFVQHPESQQVHQFQPATFSASVQGTTPFTIQWLRNGTPIPGATQLNYTISSVTTALNGSVFTVRVSNPVGSATSSGAVLTVTVPPPPPQTFLLDFGASATTTAFGPMPNDPVLRWNNVPFAIGTSSTGQVPNLVTDQNINTTVGFAMVNRFNGSNSNGTTSSSHFPANATVDSLFGNTETFNGLSNVFPRFKFTGLDPTRTYSFTFFGSRTGSADNRETRYTVTGANSGTQLLNTANNTNDTATVSGIVPDAGNEVTISLAPGPNNNNSNHFTYLGVVRMVASGGVSGNVPQINGASTASGTYGSSFSYTIEASNAPTSYGATGLPPGLSANPLTGAITGTPTVAGTFTATVSATNALGTGQASLGISITKANATVSLGALNHTFNGAPKNATATTIPAGLPVTFTYNGSAMAPSAAGSYSVHADVVHANYQGFADGTMTITGGATSFDPDAEAYIQSVGLTGNAASTLDRIVRELKGTYTGADRANTSATNYWAAMTDAWVFDRGLNIDGGGTGGVRSLKLTHNITANGAVLDSFNGLVTDGVNDQPMAGLTETYSTGFTYLSQNNATAQGTSSGGFAALGTNLRDDSSGSNGNALTLKANGSGGLMLFGFGTASSELRVNPLSGSGTGTRLLWVSASPASATWSFGSAGGSDSSVFFGPSDNNFAPTQVRWGWCRVYSAGVPSHTVVNTRFTAILGRTTTTAERNEIASILELPVGPGSASGSAPQITSASTADGNFGSPFSYTIDASNAPTSYGATGLPPGLSANPLTGAITGTPTAAGNFTATVSATNALGTGQASLGISIAKANATVSLGALNHTFDGALKNATATTIPAGLPVTFTYNGSPMAPSTAGSYSVHAEVVHANYQGFANGTMTITGGTTSLDPDALAYIQAVGLTGNAASTLDRIVRELKGTYTGPDRINDSATNYWAAMTDAWLFDRGMNVDAGGTGGIRSLKLTHNITANGAVLDSLNGLVTDGVNDQPTAGLTETYSTGFTYLSQNNATAQGTSSSGFAALGTNLRDDNSGSNGNALTLKANGSGGLMLFGFGTASSELRVNPLSGSGTGARLLWVSASPASATWSFGFAGGSDSSVFFGPSDNNFAPTQARWGWCRVFSSATPSPASVHTRFTTILGRTTTTAERNEIANILSLAVGP